MNAEELIGKLDADNDKLELEQLKAIVDEGKHPSLTGLREILDHSRIDTSFTRRSEASSAASSAQSKFWWLSLASIAGVAIATISSGALLYGAGVPEEAATEVGTQELADSTKLAAYLAQYETTFRWLQIIGAFIAAAATAILSTQDYLGAWSNNRRRSEDLRRQIFTDIFNMAATRGASATPGENSLLSQALELFRRFQLELQINYYKDKAGATSRSWSLLGWATAILSGLTAIIGLVAGTGRMGLVAAAFLGIMIPVLLTAVQSWRAANLFGDKAKAYKHALDELLISRGKLSDVRDHSANGNEAKVREFIDEVQEVMKNENTNWVAASVDN